MADVLLQAQGLGKAFGVEHGRAAFSHGNDGVLGPLGEHPFFFIPNAGIHGPFRVGGQIAAIKKLFPMAGRHGLLGGEGAFVGLHIEQALAMGAAVDGLGDGITAFAAVKALEIGDAHVGVVADFWRAGNGVEAGLGALPKLANLCKDVFPCRTRLKRAWQPGAPPELLGTSVAVCAPHFKKNPSRA